MKKLVQTLTTAELANYIVEFAAHESLDRLAQAALIFPSSHMIAASHRDTEELRMKVSVHPRVFNSASPIEYRENPISFRVGNLLVRNAPMDSLFSLRGCTYCLCIIDLTASVDMRAVRNTMMTSMEKFADHPLVGTALYWDRGDRSPE